MDKKVLLMILDGWGEADMTIQMPFSPRGHLSLTPSGQNILPDVFRPAESMWAFLTARWEIPKSDTLISVQAAWYIRTL